MSVDYIRVPTKGESCMVGNKLPVFEYYNRKLERSIAVQILSKRDRWLCVDIEVDYESVNNCFHRSLFISGLNYSEYETLRYYSIKLCYYCVINNMSDCEKLLIVLNSICNGWEYDKEKAFCFFMSKGQNK